MPSRGLSKQVIVDAAFAQLAEGGLDSITARALGERLGVRAGALYYHVPDMGALADEMATAITRELAADAGEVSGLTWDALLRASAVRVRSVLLSYRDGARLFSGTFITDPAVVAGMEVPLRVLTDAGLSVDDALRALQTVQSFVVGFVIEEQHRRPDGEQDPRYDPEFRRARLDPDQFPLSRAVSDDFAALGDAAFDWGVEAIIAGIGARLGLVAASPDPSNPAARR
jgi:TetR/AcrR family transcriptional regulator, tetracycline repressor protein